jgi:hypothetical protein
MKLIIPFLILIFFFSFTQRKNDRIDEFENALGETETRYLNELVNDFDSFLNEKFKGEEFKFIKYLTEISESNQPELWKISMDKFVEIQKTNLFARYDSIFPDSVWYDDKGFNVSYSYMGIRNSITITQKKNQELDVDAIIKSLKNKPELKEVEPGYFQISLESVMSGNTLIKNYLDAKKTAGTLSIRLVADGLLRELKDENEYFAKRILIMEMND